MTMNFYILNILSANWKNSGIKKIVLFFAVLISTGLSAQHEQHKHSDSTKSEESGKDSIQGVNNAGNNDMPPMTHAFSLNLPMTRNASGTGWLPDASPMYGYMIHEKKWMYMLHGNVFTRYNHQDVFNKGTRGDVEFDVVSWFMLMGQRKLGKNGLFHFSTMLSPDNLFGGNGYPLLFQTGETWEGQPLVDRQHPHDLFSELSVSYAYAINKNTDAFIYVAYPGEPALGSVAFMHRVSALYGPDAPLTHHWNDGTHISFGVVTAGVRWKQFKIEASTFTGREPDENRYNFDKPHLDSYSGKISCNPNANWALEISEGFVKSPESIRPEEDVRRTTASAIFSKRLKEESFINATALWGLNRSHSNEHAALLEAVLVISRFAFYGRYEYVEKSIDELNLETNGFTHDAIFPINAFTLGSSYDILRTKAGRIALGAQASVYSADSRLDNLYGKNPVSAEIFVRIYPPAMGVRQD
jgi:hypothetical protein